MKYVVVSMNEKYVPYFSVLLSSIIRNVEDKDEYTVFALHDNLPVEHQKKLETMINGKRVGLQFINVHDRTQSYSFFVCGEKMQQYISREAYFRLMAPELFPQCDQVLYLDCDIVVNAGWDSIFEVDLGDCLLAGIADIWDNGKCCDKNSIGAKYRKTELEINDPFQYFNSGVMLLNLKEFRSMFEPGELLKIAASREWKKHDQDVLNKVCRGKVLFLDYKWNLIECPDQKEWKQVPQDELVKYQKSINGAFIVHYASRKPWLVRGVQHENFFWENAVSSPYFDELFSQFIEEQLQNGKVLEETVYKSIKKGKIGVRFIIKCILQWFQKRTKK